MHALTLEEIIKAMNGRPLGKPPAITISAIGTDSRNVKPGELFFALRGERFDAHMFIADALNAGAAAVVAHDFASVPDALRSDGRIILVSDTTAALGQLANFHRRQSAATVIAVAGSNGKTTTKAMIGAVLTSRFRGRAAVKSFNNAVGVPLTLLSAERGDEFLVVEIGTNAPGEVAALGRIAEPDVAVLTSLGEEHLEFFDDLSRVAEEEASLLTRLRNGAFAAVHEDMADAATAAGSHVTRIRFGTAPASDLRASDIRQTTDGLHFLVNERFEYRLPILGPHNAVNALAAIAVGRRFKMDHAEIAAALATFTPPPMRLELVHQHGITIINDAYNANPSSVRAAIATLEAVASPGRKIVLLGDMHELGAQAERCHAEIGAAMGRSSAHMLICVGRFARTMTDQAAKIAGADKAILSYPDHASAATALPGFVREGDVILLKGSRASAMEKLTDALRPDPTKTHKSPVRGPRKTAVRSSAPRLPKPKRGAKA